MLSPTPYAGQDCYHFPQQKVLCDNTSYSHDLLHSLLESIYNAAPPFTGYLTFSGDECALLFLFFFNGAPYAAGRYADSKPVCYTIQELGGQIVKSAEKSLNVTLCETDPVLLKSMLLFLQEEPAIKAPTSLLDFEYIVRQISEAGANAMIALSRENRINFYFFRDGKGALIHYGDQSFKRPGGMTINEEMLLYAFQPGEKVQAYIFRDMITTMSEDSGQVDRNSLYKLLTLGYLVDRRTGRTPVSPEKQKGRRKEDREKLPESVESGDRKPKPLNVVLAVESGPLAGERFTVALPCSIGRKDCDLILNDRLVSRRHAELRIVEHKLEIADLKSTNGTLVNGKKITSSHLHPNDLICIGPTSLRVLPA